MKNALIFTFGRIHFIQVSYIREKLQKDNCNLYVVGPNTANNADFIFNFNPGSFLECINSGFIAFIEDKILELDITSIFITDLNLPLQNLIASSPLISKKSVQIYFYYDGLINIINGKISLIEKSKDLFKYFIAKCFLRNYTIRKNLINGTDLSLARYYNLNDVLDTFILSFQSYFKSFKGCSPKQHICIYLSQGHIGIESKYNEYLLSSLRKIKVFYPDFEIMILERPNYPCTRLHGYRYIERNFPSESAEEVCFRLNPSVVVSANSTALFNLKLINFSSELVSLNLKELYKMFSEDGYDDIIELFKKNNITII